MKHVKLFESWMEGSVSYKAVSVFPEGGSDLFVGFFPTEKADQILQELSACSGIVVNSLDLPADHDIVVSELGGEGLYSGNSSAEDLGWPNLVKLGDDYEFENEPATIPFLVDKNIDGFVGVGGFGTTQFVSVPDMLQMCRG
jgi:hypothetical protein